MYDMSIATDYAVGLGRDRYCARVPLDRTKMAAVVGYLNQVNAPYRSGLKVFHWNVLEKQLYSFGTTQYTCRGRGFGRNGPPIARC